MQRGPDEEWARFLRQALLAWYARFRRDLPWRRTRDPYAIWLSEVMLQQTRVDTVVPYYERFLSRWPTVESLAEAPIDHVLAAWSGLGYYRRARLLHEGARSVARTGRFPRTAAELGGVPGIGRYTAGAIASIALGEAAPLVDGNVARVFARLFAIDEDVKSTKGIARLWSLAAELVDREDPGAWNQALMELGATVCTPREPRCAACPVHSVCRARAQGREAELPRAKAKAKPRVQRRWAIVASEGDQVLLGRRALDARFGGLWEPPMIDVASPDESPAAAARRIGALAGARLGGVKPAGEVTHVLSHRRLEVSVLRATLRALPGDSRAPRAAPVEYVAFALVDPKRPGQRGMSTLARKVLSAAIG